MLDDLRNERLKKRAALEQAGFDPYPATVKRTARIAEIIKDWKKYALKKTKLTVVGRVFGMRGQGGISFLDLKDESAGIQIVLQKDSTNDFTIVRDNTDIGDFIEATGAAFVTKKGEKSIQATDFRIISKSIRPIPSEWYGIEDQELRFRRRYLELAIKPEVREMFRKKTAFWASTRDYLIRSGFLEVETPVLESVTGGADARPFITHHNALDIDTYLRISPELHLKRLLVGGFERVFEIGRIFRNEGIDDEHLQDYTQMEMYWAYQDYVGLMDFVEKLVKYVIKTTFGETKLLCGWGSIDWGKKWPRVDYFELLSKEWGVDAAKLTVPQLYELAKKLHVTLEPNLGRGRALDNIYKKTVRPKLIQPMFLINPPVDVEPLAKRIPGKSDCVERFQILAMGSELGKGFSELNDPVDQRGRFEEQAKLRAAGDEEAQMNDIDFVEALEYGMPPAAGFAYSERLFAILMDKPVRECVFFPILRPKK